MFSTTLRTLVLLPALAAVAPAGVADGHDAAGVSTRAPVTTEAALRRAWTDPLRRRIDLGADIMLRDCRAGDPMRESPYPLLLDGHGHTLRQTCFEQRVLRQDGTGYLELRELTLTRGGADGPGAALATRGELAVHGRRGDEEPRRGAGRRIVLDAAASRSAAPTSTATWPTTTAAACTPAGAACRSTTPC